MSENNFTSPPNDEFPSNASFSTTPVFEVFPSLDEPSSLVFSFSAVSLTLFVFGVCGNAATLTRLVIDTRRRRMSHFGTNGTKVQLELPGRVFLCAVNVLMLLSLPTQIIDNLVGFWMFGNGLCKFHHFCATTGKVFAIVPLIAMTLRCHALAMESQLRRSRMPLSSASLASANGSLNNLLLFTTTTKSNASTERSSQTFFSAVMFVLLAVAFLLPILIFAEAQKLFLFESARRDGTRVRVRVFKCVDTMPEAFLFAFTGSMFALSFFIPLLGITALNLRIHMSRFTGQQTSVSVASPQVPMNGCARRVALLSALHFVCWTPYWVSIVYGMCIDLFGLDVNNDSHNNEANHGAIATWLYVAHTFPHVNAAANWLLLLRPEGSGAGDAKGAITKDTSTALALALIGQNHNGTFDNGIRMVKNATEASSFSIGVNAVDRSCDAQRRSCSKDGFVSVAELID